MQFMMHTKGLMCGKCEAKAESALLALDGVEEAEANYTDNIITIDVDDTQCSIDSFKAKAIKAISDAGYSVCSIEEDN